MPTSTYRKGTDDGPLDTLIGETGSDAAVVAATARASTSPVEIHVDDHTDRPAELRVYGFDPDDGHQLIDTVDLERRRAHPASKTGDIRVNTPEALIRYARRHLNVDFSTLWGDIDGGRITVVLNDHGDLVAGQDDPGWADHRASLQLDRSSEWKAWTSICGQELSQVELAEFLEEHLLEVVDPDGSTLLEITQTFHATSDVRFKSSQRLHSGEQQLIYEEDVQASAGATGQATIPTEITVALRPWVGVDPVEVKASFRFRVRAGQLVLGVKLLRLDEVSRDAVSEALAAVAAELDLDPIEGTAPGPRR